MEPMALGSPGGSPAASPYLPSFLMGEQQVPATPRSNTLSPNKPGGRNISFSFATSPNSPPDFSRSAMGQKTLFGGYQQTNAAVQSVVGPNTPIQSHNSGVSGPPTQGLFDSLRNERNQIQTPTRGGIQSPSHFGTPLQNTMQSGLGISQNYQQQQQLHQTGLFNDSYQSTNNTSFNVSRAPFMSPLASGSPSSSAAYDAMVQYPPTPRYTDFWVTVYGFPSTATSTILQHFSQCGTIVDKIFPPQNGNWVHLKYSSRLECDKALNYNEKILANNIMIGVTQCKDRSIIDKENLCENVPQALKVRPLAQTAYKSAQNDTSVVTNSSVPQKSSGLMNKAMDLFFGW